MYIVSYASFYQTHEKQCHVLYSSSYMCI